MIVDKVACDWLTLTTFVEAEGNRLWKAAEAVGNGNKATWQRVMQYEGSRQGSSFFGMAIQKGRRNWMLRVSGEAAQTCLEGLPEQVFGNCTRIDLQYTMRITWDYSARRLADMLNASIWSGRQRVATLIEGGHGLDTVGIGNRTSESFTRIYVKRCPDGDYLRYEVEYKGKKAEQVYTLARVDADSMPRILRAEIDKLPRFDNQYMDKLRKALEYHEPHDIKFTSRVEETNRTLAWVVRVVSPVIYRLLRDHDTGGIVGQLVQEWHDTAVDLDRISTSELNLRASFIRLISQEAKE